MNNRKPIKISSSLYGNFSNKNFSFYSVFDFDCFRKSAEDKRKDRKNKLNRILNDR